MMEQTKIIVVGGNASGPSASAKAKRVNPNADVKLFEKSKFISTGTCELPYVLSGKIDNYKKILFFDEKSFKQEKAVDVFTSHLVEEINRKEKYIIVKNLIENKINKYHYDKLILTTGSIAKKYPLFHSNFENVTTLKSVSDLIKVQKLIDRANNKTVCIIGSGFIGLELCEAFSELNFDVYLIEKEANPLPFADKEIQSLIFELLKKKNINFYGNIEQLKFFSENNLIKSITVDGRYIDIDFAIEALGFEPNNLLALSSKLELATKGGIKVNKKLQTSDPNIYAAGDCIEVTNFITNRSDFFPLATLAYETGHIAGENSAGGNSFFESVIKNISLKIFNKFFVQVGLSETEAKKYSFNFKTVSAVSDNLVKVMPESNSVFGKIIYERDSKKILGATFFGANEVSGYADLISTIIKSNLPATILNKIDFNYTPPLSPFINLLKVLGKKIKD